jgi:hypothetical protein
VFDSLSSLFSPDWCSSNWLTPSDYSSQRCCSHRSFQVSSSVSLLSTLQQTIDSVRCLWFKTSLSLTSCVVKRLMDRYRRSGVALVDSSGRLVGATTGKDLGVSFKITSESIHSVHFLSFPTTHNFLICIFFWFNSL